MKLWEHAMRWLFHGSEAASDTEKLNALLAESITKQKKLTHTTEELTSAALDQTEAINQETRQIRERTAQQAKVGAQRMSELRSTVQGVLARPSLGGKTQSE